VHPTDQKVYLCGSGGAACISCAVNTAFDSCVNGACSCGDAGPCTTPGFSCLNGQCACDPASCTGCCTAAACVAIENQGPSQCGEIGDACQPCPAPAECESGSCACRGPRFVCAGASGVGAGGDHTCAATSPITLSTARCWGSDTYGQLGIDAPDAGTDQLGPATVNLTEVEDIAASDTFTCVTSNHAVWCWGDTPLGSFASPSSVGDPISSPLSAVSALTVGESHACAITTDGMLYCWGDGSLGQVGAGDAGVLQQPVPVLAIGYTGAHVAAGRTHTCALGDDGGVVCWGTFDAAGATPFDAPAPTLVPLPFPARSIAAGDGVTCAAGSGTVACFGKTSPAVGTWAMDTTQLCVGSGYACSLTPAAGVVCWGENSHDQLGSADAGAVSALPLPVSGLDAGVAAISCGRAHACAIGLGGQLYCWGEGAHYKLGNASTRDQPGAIGVSD
jgi:hypothetical protein